uniref:C2H2-type domain-containing protein n=1 Tax=Heterorhabditis bacteriophora TaxID=37862 RepID=A0A1I7XD34_HETBA
MNGLNRKLGSKQRIALLGFRSKAKDAMAVMERVANPQAIDINTVNFPIISDLSSYHTNRIPRLSDLCADILVPKRNEYLVPTAEEFDRPITVKKGGVYNHKPQTGHLCNVCRRLFASYKEYDLHLEAEGCADDEVPDPLPVQISLLGTIPSEYGYGIRTSRPLTIRRRHICSACHKDDFISTSAFHQHIIDCSRMLQYV